MFGMLWGGLLHALAMVLGVLLSCSGAEMPELPAIVHHIIEEEPVAQLAILQQVSDDDGFLLRSCKSPAHRHAAQQDAIGNVHGELRGVNASPSALLMGSHYDTVKDAGAFDGPLGIVTAVAAVKALVATSPQCMPLNDSTASSFSLTQTGTGDKSPTAASIFSFLSRLATGAPAEVATGAVEEIVTLRDVSPCVGEFLAGVGHKVNVRVVAFTDEEGVRFQSTFLGSRALAGTLSKEILATPDAEGKTIAQTLNIPACPNRAACSDEMVQKAVRAMQLPQGSVHAYVEAHLEQGPVLEASGVPVGVVSAIAGQSRWVVSVQGEQGHAGTVPMHLRKDPMPVAGSIMHAISKRCTLPPARPDSDIMYAMHVAFQRLATVTPEWLQDAATAAFSKLPEGFSSWLQGLWSTVMGSVQIPKLPYLVCTVGTVDVWPGASNVIPKTVNFTVDVRSDDENVRGGVEEWLQGAVAKACEEASLPACIATRRNAAGSVQSSVTLTDTLVESAESALRMHAMRGFSSGAASDAAMECARSMHVEHAPSEEFCAECKEESGLGAGFSTSESASVSRGVQSMEKAGGACSSEGGVEVGPSVPLMTSGAGHDALAMAEIAPVAMLFVRCRAGISHSPEEFVAPEDVIAATRVLLELVLRDSGIV